VKAVSGQCSAADHEHSDSRQGFGHRRPLPPPRRFSPGSVRLSGPRHGLRPIASDADFLVSFTPAARNDLGAYLDFNEALEALLSRPVDLVEREAVEASRNSIRRRTILISAAPLYG